MICLSDRFYHLDAVILYQYLVLPLFYDSTARKAFEAVAATYKDIFVYVFFYSLIIISFAIVANQVIEIPQGA